MSFDALALAKLGIGYGAVAALSLGLVGGEPAAEVAVEMAPVVRPVGSGHYDTGNGYVRREHGWVKATKTHRVGVADHFTVMPRVFADGRGATARHGVTPGAGQPTAGATAAFKSIDVRINCIDGRVLVEGSVTGEVSRIACRHGAGGTTTLAADELLALLDLTEA